MYFKTIILFPYLYFLETVQSDIFMSSQDLLYFSLLMLKILNEYLDFRGTESLKNHLSQFFNT